MVEFCGTDGHFFPCHIQLTTSIRTLLVRLGVAHSSATWVCFNYNGHLRAGIAPKKLAPIVMAAAIWGKSLAGCHIAFHSDNMAVVAVLNKRMAATAKDPFLLHLLCCLYFYSAFYSFHHSTMHVHGVFNVHVYSGRCRVIHDLCSLVPQVLPVPSQVPDSLIRLLLDNTPDWTSDS